MHSKPTPKGSHERVAVVQERCGLRRWLGEVLQDPWPAVSCVYRAPVDDQDMTRDSALLSTATGTGNFARLKQDRTIIILILEFDMGVPGTCPERFRAWHVIKFVSVEAFHQGLPLWCHTRCYKRHHPNLVFPHGYSRIRRVAFVQRGTLDPWFDSRRPVLHWLWVCPGVNMYEAWEF